MPPVKIQTGYLPAEIELWGGVYETVDQTTAQEERAVELYNEAASDPKQASAIVTWGKYLDLILCVQNPGTRKPSTALKAEFKKGTITSRSVVGVILQIRAAEQGVASKVLQQLAAGVRPT